jgi:Xaa-Pro aminopeptidase
MMVFCGRREGLYANLTRIVSFSKLSKEEEKNYQSLLEIEKSAFDASIAGYPLHRPFQAMKEAYAQHGLYDEYLKHHQGGTTGYLSREIVAHERASELIEPPVALAWNPSMAGLKVEDTVLLNDGKIEVLTTDGKWPTKEISGLLRPRIWER